MEYPKLLISGSYSVFNECWDAAGVYMCSGLYQSPTFKLPIYIGSTVSLQRRIEYEHISSLNRNQHPHNPPLQYAWNKYGQENFVWWLLETCPKEETLVYEDKYLNLYRPFVDEFGGFNISHDATNFGKDMFGERNPFYGKRHTEETKRKLSERFLGSKLSEKTKQKISDSNTGKKMSEENRKRMIGNTYSKGNKFWVGKKHREESKAKMGESHAKEFKLVSPNGEIVIGKNLYKFARENSLNQGNLWKVIFGKVKRHKGWEKYSE